MTNVFTRCTFSLIEIAVERTAANISLSKDLSLCFSSPTTNSNFTSIDTVGSDYTKGEMANILLNLCANKITFMRYGLPRVSGEEPLLKFP